MEENKGIKVRLSTVICIFIIIILVIALAGMYYYYNSSKKTIESNVLKTINVSNTVKNTNNIASNTAQNSTSKNIVEEIPETDVLLPVQLFNTYVKDGSFYYSETETGSVKKYSELNNIKNMRTYNMGTSVNSTTFLITEDGEVYQIWDNNGKIKAIKYEPLANYVVEDILEKTGEMQSIFTLKLKDETIKTVTIQTVD